MSSNGDCIVEQSPESCQMYEHQKDIDLAAQQNGNTIIIDDGKKHYHRQEKRARKNTILEDTGKYRVKE